MDPKSDRPRSRVFGGLGIAGLVLSIFVAFILAGAILPTSFSQIFNASTAGWTTATVTVFQLLPLLGVVSIILTLVFVGGVGRGKK